MTRILIPIVFHLNCARMSAALVCIFFSAVPCTKILLLEVYSRCVRVA